MGPLANQRRQAAITHLVANARAKGGQLKAGGKASERGFFFAPTLVSEVPDTAEVMSVEPFGPLAVTQAFDDVDAAVAAANAVRYGLTAFVFTENGRRARHLAAALDVGMVGVNGFGISGADSPFGGVKDSGFGREGGSWGLESFTTLKAIHET